MDIQHIDAIGLPVATDRSSMADTTLLRRSPIGSSPKANSRLPCTEGSTQEKKTAGQPHLPQTDARVVSIPHVAQAYTNRIYMCEADARHLCPAPPNGENSRHVRVNGVAFSLEVHPDVSEGKLAMNLFQREWMRLRCGDLVRVKGGAPQAAIELGTLRLSLRFWSVPPGRVGHHDYERMRCRIRKQFQGQVLRESQQLALLEDERAHFELTVLRGTPLMPAEDIRIYGQGVFSEHTKLELESPPTGSLRLLQAPDMGSAQASTQVSVGCLPQACTQEHRQQWPEWLCPWTHRLWVQGSDLEVADAGGPYVLFSKSEVVNGMPFWKQLNGPRWLFAGLDGTWRLGRLPRVWSEESAGSSSNKAWTAEEYVGRDEWRSQEHGGRLPQDGNLLWYHVYLSKGTLHTDALQSFHVTDEPEGCSGEATAGATGGSARIGSPANILAPQPGEAPPPFSQPLQQALLELQSPQPVYPTLEQSHSVTALHGHSFVSNMQSHGMRNWVIHNGQVINLEDPGDTAMLDDVTFSRLVEQATGKAGEDPQAPRPPPVPLQPWEVEKLFSVASQVTNALHSGRYVKDFGEILVSQLGGWAGDQAWAQEEQRRLAGLVEQDDAQSRELLRRWVEDSLLQSLREVMKEFNRGQLAGASSARCMTSTGSAMSLCVEQALTAAASSGGSSAASASGGDAAAKSSRGPAADEDELALQAALQASLEDCDDAVEALPDGEGEAEEAEEEEQEEEEEQGEFEVEDVGSSEDEAWQDLGSEAGAHGAGREELSEKPGGSEQQPGGSEKEPGGSVQEAAPVSAPSVAGGCGHACDLSGGCCSCVVRAPRPGAVPGLVAWWQRCGVSHLPLGSSAARLRFFCATCAADASGEESRRWSLPFGGVLLLKEGRPMQFVGPASSPSGAQATEVSWEDASSWVALEEGALGEAGSEASWLIAQQ